MKVAVVSDDESVYNFCKCILADCARFPQSEVLVLDPREFLVDPRNRLPDADVYVWDLLPEVGSAPWLGSRYFSHNIFLAERESLAKIEPLASGMVLIQKPISESILTHWLDVFFRNNQVQNLVLREEGQERQWSDFLARAVHDLRAPLTAASGYCGLLVAGEMGPLTERQREILGRTQNSLARLARITTEVLDRAARRKINGKTQVNASAVPQYGGQHPEARSLPVPKPRREEADIDRSAEQAIHEIRLSAAPKNIRIKADFTRPSWPLSFDSCQLEQVFSNLLDNAVKFTPAGGRIEITGYPYGSRLFRVDVFNTGPRISTGLLERVFDEYATFGIQGGSEGHTLRTQILGNAKARSGVGLGLTISRSIIEQHEGRIWIENQPEGPCISFVLPVERSAGTLVGNLIKNERYQTNGTS